MPAQGRGEGLRSRRRPSAWSRNARKTAFSRDEVLREVQQLLLFAYKPHCSPPLAVSASRTGQSGTDGSNAVHRQSVGRARPGSLKGNHKRRNRGKELEHHTYIHSRNAVHSRRAFGQRCDIRPRDSRESPLPCHPQVQIPKRRLFSNRAELRAFLSCYIATCLGASRW